MEPINENLNRKLKQNTMRVPDDYFTNLEQSIFEKTIGTEAEQIKKTPVIKRIMIITAVAATVTAIYFSISLFGKDSTTKLAIQLAEMSDTELNNYMDDQIAALSYDDLYGYVAQHVDDISTNTIFNSAFELPAQSDASLTNDLHEQVLDQDVLNQIIDKTEINLEPTLMDPIDEEILKEYVNDATLFGRLGL